MEIFHIPVNDKGYPSDQKFGESMTDFINRKFNPPLPQGYDMHPSYKSFVTGTKVGAKMTATVKIETDEDTKPEPADDKEDAGKKKASSKKKRQVSKAKEKDEVKETDDIPFKSPPLAWDPEYVKGASVEIAHLSNTCSEMDEAECNALIKDIQELADYRVMMEKHFTPAGWNGGNELLDKVNTKVRDQLAFIKGSQTKGNGASLSSAMEAIANSQEAIATAK